MLVYVCCVCGVCVVKDKVLFFDSPLTKAQPHENPASYCFFLIVFHKANKNYDDLKLLFLSEDTVKSRDSGTG